MHFTKDSGTINCSSSWSQRRNRIHDKVTSCGHRSWLFRRISWLDCSGHGTRHRRSWHPAGLVQQGIHRNHLGKHQENCRLSHFIRYDTSEGVSPFTIGGHVCAHQPFFTKLYHWSPLMKTQVDYQTEQRFTRLCSGTPAYILICRDEIWNTLKCELQSKEQCFGFCADMSCRARLATLNEKLTALERKMDYLEARVG